MVLGIPLLNTQNYKLPCALHATELPDYAVFRSFKMTETKIRNGKGKMVKPG